MDELLTGAYFREILLHGLAREAIGNVDETRGDGVAAPQCPCFDLERRPDRHLRVGAPPVPEEMVAQLTLLCHLLLRPLMHDPAECVPGVREHTDRPQGLLDHVPGLARLVQERQRWILEPRRNGKLAARVP